MTDARLRVASINAPERTDRSKRNLLAPAKRAVGILRWLRRESVDVAVLQESGSVMRACVAAHPKWRWIAARPNTVIRGHQLGNTMVVRRTIKVRDGLDINVPLKGRKRGLWLPVRLLEHTSSGALFVAIGVHKARARGVPGGTASRAASDRLVSAHARAGIDAGFPTIPAGDWNGPPPKIEGFKTAADSGPDSILTSTDIAVLGVWYVPLPRLIDHPDAILVDLAIPVRSITPKRLPKP